MENKLIEIKNRFTGEVIFSWKAISIKACLEIAVKTDADLRGADLRRTNLRGAYLRDADLRGADLSGANLIGVDLIDAYLSGANLRGANLRRANLRGADLIDAYLRGAYLTDADLSDADLSDANLSGANLRRANLRGADLIDAYLRGAYLSGANLRGADLRGADLSGADLRGAYLSGDNLTPIKTDVFAILDLVNKIEIDGLWTALKQGKVDGSVYEGECCCLVGTLANVKRCSINDSGLSRDEARPAERIFMGISKGDTPETNPISKIVIEWINEYQEKQ